MSYRERIYAKSTVHTLQQIYVAVSLRSDTHQFEFDRQGSQSLGSY